MVRGDVGTELAVVAVLPRSLSKDCDWSAAEAESRRKHPARVDA